MKPYNGLARFIALSALSLGLAGCFGGSDDDGQNAGGDTGQMSLAVTDAPVDQASKVVVRFTHIELNPAGDDDRIRIDFDDPVKEIDLLSLQGEKSEFLFEDEEIPAGDYDWIRFYLEAEEGASSPPLSNFATSSYIQFEDESRDEYRENLIIPGGLQAGLQMVSGFTVPANESVSFTVDFDLRKAIKPDNRFEGYHRMRRALRLVDNARVGTITGTLDEAILPEDFQCHEKQDLDYHVCPGASVYVFEGEDQEPRDLRDDGDDAVTTANVRFHHLEETNEWEYRYTAGFLNEGDYTVALTFEADGDDPEVETPIDFADQKNATVEAGETTEINFHDAD